jgi:hypothetical protein
LLFLICSYLIKFHWLQRLYVIKWNYVVVMHTELLKDFEGGTCPFQVVQTLMRKIMKQVCANPGCQVPWSAKFCVAVPYICGSAVWNFLHVTRLTPRILWWLLDFWKICAFQNSVLDALAQMSLKDRLESFPFGLTMLFFVCILFY